MSKFRKKGNIRKKKRKVWQLQEAKSRFSELVNDVIHDGYRTITKNGQPVAVIISTKEFEKLKTQENTLIDFFSESPLPEFDLDIQRSKDTGREIDL